MSFSLPNPNVPTNGQPGDATPLLQNEVAIAQAIASFDGSQVQSKTITEGALADAVNPRLRGLETLANFVYTGCVWSLVSGLSGTMTAGTIYVNGYRTLVTGVGANTFAASSDTYVDIDYLGNITYNAVSNGASAPSLTANSLRVAKIVTSGVAITSIVQSGVDSNNVQVYPTSPTLPQAWKSWTPTWAGGTPAIGADGNIAAKYTQFGKTVVFRMILTSGSLTTFGSGAWSFTLPVVSAQSLTTFMAIGTWTALSTTGGNVYMGITTLNASTTAFSGIYHSAATDGLAAQQLGSANPVAWTAGQSIILMNGRYEAA